MINKMGPQTRRCFNLSPARNHPSESKRVLVQSRNVIATKNITWAHVSLARRVTVQSKLSVEGERNDWLQDREASSVDGRATEDKIGLVASSSSGDSSCGKQVPPQSTSGRVISLPNAGRIGYIDGKWKSCSLKRL